ncbi:hypothetical protein HY031_02335, partial [Candidatus Gottesmanbacteria bacterium]|nr:hypothetical protein [Candidatus Gottesmanbacteria bacterium]
MAEKKQPAKTIASPTLDNVRVNPVYADALRYLLFAQELDPTGRYARFVQNLAVEAIPYQYTDPRFLAALVDFVKDFKAYLAEARIPEVRIESSVPHVMVESLAKELTAMPATIRGVKRERIEQITDAYVKRLRRVVGRFGGEETFKKSLTEEVTRLAQESNTIGEFEGKLEDALTNKAAAISTDPAKIAEVARPVAHNVLSRATDLLPALLAPSEEEPVVTKALIESSVKRKDLWVKTYTQKAGREAQPNIEDVNRLAATAEAFLSVASGPDLTKPTLFFRTGAKGLQKPLAILADTMLEVFPKETRDAVIESVLRRGWDVATQTDKLNKKFGELVVDSGVLQAAIEKGNLAFGIKEQRSFKGLTNAASDIASTIFGSPRSTEDILALVELGIIKEDYIAGYLPAYVAGAHANRSGLFDLIFNLGANWGIQ